MPQKLLTHLKNQKSSGDITELEAEFIEFFWEKLKEDYLRSPKNPLLWLPHIGMFFIKEQAITKKVYIYIDQLRKWRVKPKSDYNDKKIECLKTEFRIYWALYKKVDKYHKERKIEIKPKNK